MLTLNVTPQAADVIIASLRQLPHVQVHDLVMDLFGQVQSQLKEAPAEVDSVEDFKAGCTD